MAVTLQKIYDSLLKITSVIVLSSLIIKINENTRCLWGNMNDPYAVIPQSH